MKSKFILSIIVNPFFMDMLMIIFVLHCVYHLNSIDITTPYQVKVVVCIMIVPATLSTKRKLEAFWNNSKIII